MRLTCPHCERPTYKQIREGNLRIKPDGIPEGALVATTLDGTCHACWRQIKGKVRMTSKGVMDYRELVYRHTMTDDDVRTVRKQLLKLVAARRARGVHPDGVDPELLHRPGLTLMEA